MFSLNHLPAIFIESSIPHFLQPKPSHFSLVNHLKILKDGLWLLRTGDTASAHEELATVLDQSAESSVDTNDANQILVKYTILGYQSLVEADRVRIMDYSNQVSSERGVRRSTRGVSASLPTATDGGSSDVVTVTPSPTEIGSTKSESDGAVAENPKKRKASKSLASKKVSETPYFTKPDISTTDDVKTSPYFSKTARAKTLLELSSGDDDSDAPLIQSKKARRSGDEAAKKVTAGKSDGGDKTESKNTASSKKDSGMNADATKKAAARKSNNSKGEETSKTAKSAAKKPDNSTNGARKTPKKKAAAKRSAENNNSSTPTRSAEALPLGSPDGNGGLNQPSPFNVEYSKSSRATCRTCDEIIKKGGVRVGHTPLFRGKVSPYDET